MDGMTSWQQETCLAHLVNGCEGCPYKIIGTDMCPNNAEFNIATQEWQYKEGYLNAIKNR